MERGAPPQLPTRLFRPPPRRHYCRPGAQEAKGDRRSPPNSRVSRRALRPREQARRCLRPPTQGGGPKWRSITALAPLDPPPSTKSPPKWLGWSGSCLEVVSGESLFPPQPQPCGRYCGQFRLVLYSSVSGTVHGASSSSQASHICQRYCPVVAARRGVRWLDCEPWWRCGGPLTRPHTRVRARPVLGASRRGALNPRSGRGTPRRHAQNWGQWCLPRTVEAQRRVGGGPPL